MLHNLVSATIHLDSATMKGIIPQSCPLIGCYFAQIVPLSVGCKSTNSCEHPCYWVCLNCPMNKLSDNVASVPVTGHSRKIEASAHLSKLMLR